jgi:hypothetical protein
MAMDAKERLSRRKSQKLGAETMFQLSGPLPKVSHTSTRRSAAGNGRGFNSVLSITLKMVVFAPMPSASVSIATNAKPGFCAKFRKP